jgi:hypothetical protein
MSVTLLELNYWQPSVSLLVWMMLLRGMLMGEAFNAADDQASPPWSFFEIC